MKNYLILFLVGKDRPGIVDEISTLLFDHGANIEDSRMAALGGCFSIMALISCDASRVVALSDAVNGLRTRGFETWFHEAQDPCLRPREAALPLRFEVHALDHPGIVQKLVGVLHRYHINIDSLNTEVTHAPLSGAPLFRLSLEAVVPADVHIARVKEELEAVAGEENLDVIFQK